MAFHLRISGVLHHLLVESDASEGSKPSEGSAWIARNWGVTVGPIIFPKMT